MSDETREKSGGADAAGDCGHLHVYDFYDHAERVCGAAWVVGGGTAKYGVLAVCTLLAVGIFGLLRLKKWGWAIVTAGCLLLSVGYLFYFEKSRAAFFLVRGMFDLVFFLYLVRAEVRDRLW